jgi:hypothetical protein
MLKQMSRWSKIARPLNTKENKKRRKKTRLLPPEPFSVERRRALVDELNDMAESSPSG